MSWKNTSSLRTIFSLAIVATSVLNAHAEYTFIDLGGFSPAPSVGATKITIPYSVNDVGQVVGESAKQLISPSASNGFLFTVNAGIKDIGRLPVGNLAVPTSISNSGDIVGYAWLGALSDSLETAVRWTVNSTAPVPLGAPSISVAALSVNNSGAAVGYRDNQAVHWDSADNETPVLFPGTTFSKAVAINDDGAFVGDVESFGFFKASIDAPPVLFDFIRFFDLNNQNQILAQSRAGAANWVVISDPDSPTPMIQDIPTSQIQWVAMNDLGNVVGSINGQVYVWSEGKGTVSLNSQITEVVFGGFPVGFFPSGLRARDINDQGWIVGDYNFFGLRRGFLLKPTAIPESRSWLYSVAATALLMTLLRRNCATDGSRALRS
jgi:hypothetical protein